MQTRSPSDLPRRALRGTLVFSLALLVLILAAAGSLRYWQGWLFWLHFTAWTVGLTLYFLRHDPALVERRLRSGPMAEQEPAQKWIQLLAVIAIGAAFVVPALDHRFHWSAIPALGIVIGHVGVAAGYFMIFRVFRENSFAAATVEVAADQTVISSGPYAVVRHPMYAGAAIMFLGAPLALGSWWGLVPGVLLIAILAARLLHEEAYLSRNLRGYDAYRRTVRWRLLPGVW